MRTMFPLFHALTPPRQESITQSHYLGRTHKPRTVHASNFSQRNSAHSQLHPKDERGWYPVVGRALPYPTSEKACGWRREDTPDGRRRLVPVA